MHRPRASVPLPATAALVLVALLAGACDRTPVGTRTLDPEALRWVTYTDRVLGYSIDYPEDFDMVVRATGEVTFRYGGVPVRVVPVTEEEGRRRGLWVGQPSPEPATLGGQPAERFVYAHRDGPFFSRTIAYVVPFRGKQLGLELRAQGDLDRVQQRMLASFRLPAP